MCGSNKKTTTTHQTSGPEQWVRDEGKSLYGDASALLANNGMQVYDGPRVAGYDGNFDLAQMIAGNVATDGTGAIGSSKGVLDQLTADVGGDMGKTAQDYMSPYLEGVLSPTLRKIREAGMGQRNDIGAQATMAGAYGDARHGVVEGLQRRDQSQLETDTTAKAYDDAYKYGQSRVDATRGQAGSLSGLWNALGGAETGQANILTSLLAGLSDKQRGVDQAQLDANKSALYEQSDRPLNQISALMQLLNATPAQQISDGTSVEKSPNTGGWAVLGNVVGSLAKAAMFCDARLKTNLIKIGEIVPGMNVYLFRYIWGGPPQVGLIAQEVEAIAPDAVIEHESGFKMVDYTAAMKGVMSRG